jgi:hypothetical protein
MATVTREQLQKLIEQLEASREELVPLKEEAADGSWLRPSGGADISYDGSCGASKCHPYPEG